eukprot:UN28216
MCSYKDKHHVYFLLELCQGGDLFARLRREQYFENDTARFYAACVIEAFDHMHRKNIIYRDLKPENLVLANNGYLKITDFGFAKHVPNGRTYTFCGTPDYLAPEIITGSGHHKGVDWWTLGILIYEMLTALPPFTSDDPLETTRNILTKQVRFPNYFNKTHKTLL